MNYRQRALPSTDIPVPLTSLLYRGAPPHTNLNVRIDRLPLRIYEEGEHYWYVIIIHPIDLENQGKHPRPISRQHKLIDYSSACNLIFVADVSFRVRYGVVVPQTNEESHRKNRVNLLSNLSCAKPQTPSVFSTIEPDIYTHIPTCGWRLLVR